MTAYVKPGKPGSAVIPRWDGGRCPLSSEVSESIRELLELHVEGREDEPELKAVARLLKLQKRGRACRAARDAGRAGADARGPPHLRLSVRGAAVHLGLSALLAYRIARHRAATFSLGFTDYGFELVSRERFELLPLLKGGLFSTENLLDDMLASLNAAELSKRQFREIARVAGLVFQGYPGQPKTNRQVQATSGLIWEVFARWDPQNPLLGQSEREVLERQLEFSRLAEALRRMRESPCAAPDAQAFALRVPDHGEPLSREAHQREARRPRAAHAAGVRQRWPPEQRSPRGGKAQAGTQLDLL